MKICFVLQRRYTPIGYYLAKLLHKKYNINEFCGYIFTRESFEFIKNQNSPKFNELLLDEEIQSRYKKEVVDWKYLKKLEKEYGLPNLWTYIELDRIIRYGQLVRAYPYDTPPYTHEEMARIVQVTAKAVIKFMDETKPDAIVFSAIGSISGLLLYQIAKKRNIKILHILSTRVGNKCTISGDYSNFEDVNKLFNQLQKNLISFPKQKQAAEEFLKNFRAEPEPYCTLDMTKNRPVDRRRQFNFLKPNKLLWSVYWWPKMIIRYLTDSNKNDYTYINPLWGIWDKLKIKFRVLLGFEKFYSQVDPKEDFALFTLHLDPEIATLLYAPFYKDQLWLIKQIARSLPLNFKLYVKEHPAMVGYRSRNFYRELKKIPNVKIIKPTVEGLSLIVNSKLIITINGTSGWEGIQLKKPVITFGKVFYNQLPMVKKCTTIEELPYLIKEQLENFKYDENSLINFMTAIFKESVDVDFVKIWKIGGDNNLKNNYEQLSPLADLMAKRLNLHSINS